MADDFRGSVDHSQLGDRRIQDVLRGRFLVAGMAFFKVEFFYSFNVRGEGRDAASSRRVPSTVGLDEAATRRNRKWWPHDVIFTNTPTQMLE
jgi:hypothetical protein